MRQQLAYFRDLPLKTRFNLNGNRLVKRSTRTAFLPDYDRWFYMGKQELCLVGEHSRLAKDYFQTNDNEGKPKEVTDGKQEQAKR